jgi:ADP-heptose:LPS heptosyltransferase
MMRTKTKVIIDRWLGSAVVICLNLAARLLGQILRINHSLSIPPERIVVCKLLGMGSIIQATPLLQTLRKKYPNAEIIFITAEANRKLLENISVVNTVLTINDRGFFPVIESAYKVLRQLWENRAGLYIDLETYSYFSTALATLSCARNRFGFYRVERNIRMGVYTHMMFFNQRAPIAQSYLQMARLAGCIETVNDLYEFNVALRDLISYKEKLKPVIGKVPENIIIINPNASDLRIERRWPTDNFILLIERLTREHPGYCFFLIGTYGEYDYVKSVYDGLSAYSRQTVFNTAGMFTLTELFALIKESRLVITNDTGPMHISFALHKPTVSLFGPASPSQYGQNPNAYGIYKNIYCSPCVHDFLTPPCGGDNQCMKKILVEEVAGLCNAIIAANTDPHGVIMIPPMNYLKIDGATSLGILERNQ